MTGRSAAACAKETPVENNRPAIRITRYDKVFFIVSLRKIKKFNINYGKLFRRNGLQPGAIASRIPHGEPNPLLSGCVERNRKIPRSEFRSIGKFDYLPVDFRSIAPD